MIERLNNLSTSHLADACLRVGAREEQQALAMTKGSSLRQQLDFQHYLDLRKQDPAYGFREHLRKIGGAVEE